MKENYSLNGIENEKKGKSVKKFAGCALLAGALAASGISIAHAQVDHTQEYCFLNNVLGVTHQIRYVNNQENSDVKAKYIFDYVLPEGAILVNGVSYKYETHETDPIYNEETNSYTLPEGFTLQDGKGVWSGIASTGIYCVAREDEFNIVDSETEEVIKTISKSR